MNVNSKIREVYFTEIIGDVDQFSSNQNEKLNLLLILYR